MEKWKKVNEKYEISTTGKLRRESKMIKGAIKLHGYYEYSMCINNKRIYALAHRLVASAFLNQPDGKNEINHKDCNPLNNAVENLEWVTHSENIRHSRALNRYPKEIKKRSAETITKDIEAKKAFMKSVSDEYGNTFQTAKAAAQAHGLSDQAVKLAIRNGHKSANRYWKYLNN
jgi:hypothetical protein